MTVSKEIQNLIDLFMENKTKVEYGTSEETDSTYFIFSEIVIKQTVKSTGSRCSTHYLITSSKYDIDIKPGEFTEDEQNLLGCLFTRLHQYRTHTEKQKKLTNLSKAIKEIRNATT